MLETIQSVLMRRDGISREEADKAVKEAREELRNILASGDFETAENYCSEAFGLEPDYLDQLLFSSESRKERKE